MTRRLALLPIAAALSTALTAHGQSLAPFYVGAGETLSYEDNLFSASNGQPKSSDTISSTSINGGLEETISRQSVYANASASRNIYNKNKHLNNTGYSVGTGLNWQTIGDLSGNLGYSASQSLTRNNNTFGLLATTDRNIQRTQQANASARWGGSGRLSLQGTYNHRRLSASSEEHATEENTQNIGSFDVSYRVSGALTTGVGVSAGKIDYPRGILLSALGVVPRVYDSDSSKRRDIYLTTAWTPNDISDLSARIGYGRTRFEKATNRSVSGPRGQIAWNWRPTGKLKFNTSYTQDTSDQTAFNPLLANNATLSTDSSVLTKVLSLGTFYEVTAKVNANASFAHTQRVVTNTAAVLATSSRSTDSSNIYSLGATWQATRTASLGCNLQRQTRDGGSSGLSRDYSMNTYSCFGQITLR